jgi:hypothetical protein
VIVSGALQFKVAEESAIALRFKVATALAWTAVERNKRATAVGARPLTE